MTDQDKLVSTMQAHIKEYQTQMVNADKHKERCDGAIQALENLFKSLQEQELEPEDVNKLSGSQGEENETATEIPDPPTQ